MTKPADNPHQPADPALPAGSVALRPEILRHGQDALTAVHPGARFQYVFHGSSGSGDRELRSAFASHRGEEVSHTGDGFFVAFEAARDGLECAVDIQRRLARHRREHGFAPGVRIGLHAAAATRERRNYIGGGVHVAARVGAAATDAEILTTQAVLDELHDMRFALSEPRSLTLKGLRDPVEVRAVDWR